MTIILSPEIKKQTVQSAAAIMSHNWRKRFCPSVLPREQWLNPKLKKGWISLLHNEELYQKTRKAANRKDAVAFGSEIVQIGNETDWRNADGSVKSPPPVNIKAITASILAHGKERYGDRLVDATLHMDEGTPQINFIFSTYDEKEKKLNWKHIHGSKHSFEREHTALARRVKADGHDVVRAAPQEFSKALGYDFESTDFDKNGSVVRVMLGLGKAAAAIVYAKKLQHSSDRKAAALEYELRKTKAEAKDLSSMLSAAVSRTAKLSAGSDSQGELVTKLKEQNVILHQEVLELRPLVRVAKRVTDLEAENKLLKTEVTRLHKLLPQAPAPVVGKSHDPSAGLGR